MADDLYHCVHCDCWINSSLGDDSPGKHSDNTGEEDCPRAPGDHNDCCEHCCYGEELCSKARDGESYEGDDPASLEPEEGDYTTGDHHTFYQDGKVVLVVPEGEDWEPLVRAHMEQEQFYPNVWFVDDHGGLTFLDYSE